MVHMGEPTENPGTPRPQRRLDEGDDAQRSDEMDTAELHDRVAQGHEWADQAGQRQGTHHRDTAQAHRHTARRIREQRQATHDDDSQH